ncbi:MAG: hypothetical protein R6X02_17335 [Enhygromyxa sp.]
MAESALDRFDPTPYLYVPLLPLQTLITLSKALLELLPKSAPGFVEDVAKQLKKAIESAEADMIERLRDDNQSSSGFDVRLDGAVDGLWVRLRDSLLGRAAYTHEGLRLLDQNPPPGVDMAEVRQKAARAQEIATRLFGAGSLEMLQRRFAEQSQLTANVLGLLEADGLADELAELVEPELLPILRRCQQEYEAMVKRRAADDKGTRPNLRETRTRLRRAILRYSQAVMLMIDEEDPASVAVVEDALRPMINLRTARGSTPEAASQAGEEDGAESSPIEVAPAEG